MVGRKSYVACCSEEKPLTGLPTPTRQSFAADPRAAHLAERGDLQGAQENGDVDDNHESRNSMRALRE